MTGEWSQVPGPDPLVQALKDELSKIILWNERSAPRSRQVAVGPSELGTECDRRLAYRIAGTPTANLDSDPWPATVGTAIHDWLERAMNRFQQHQGDHGYLTELRVYPDELVKGRCDLYNHKTSMVIDWKTAGADVMRKVQKGQIPDGYKTQVQIYGLGHRRAGREVKDVALVFLPRSGWLRDMYVWRAPYDESVAKAALDRMYRIVGQLIEMDIETNPHRFQLIDAAPGDNCVWCPFFLKERDPDIAADDKGCPGR